MILASGDEFFDMEEFARGGDQVGPVGVGEFGLVGVGCGAGEDAGGGACEFAGDAAALEFVDQFHVVVFPCGIGDGLAERSKGTIHVLHESFDVDRSAFGAASAATRATISGDAIARLRDGVLGQEAEEHE